MAKHPNRTEHETQSPGSEQIESDRSLDETLPHGASACKTPVGENFFSGTGPVEATNSISEGTATEEPTPTIMGDYELLDNLGEGGMGVVFRARQRSANRTVALKVIRPERLSALLPAKKKEAIDRFHTEAQAAAALEHDNIVTVYDVGEVDGQQYFSMRYVDGRSLADLLRDGPLENRRAAEYMEPVARAVHEAHQHGVLHRDLKPQNILVDDRSDRALVADFGLAKLTEQEEELTRAGEVMGTPQYMSPEQARDSAHVTEQSDLYALGATLYHLLTGRPAFQAATPIETLRQVIDELPVAPRQLNPAIDRDLETICIKCLEKEPARRYDSAEQLADELGRYLNGEPIQARPIGVLGRTWRWGQRNPLAASSIGAAFGCLVLALVVMTVAYFQTAAAQRRSEASFFKALDMVNVFFTRVSEETLLDQPGLQPLRKDLLHQAREYYTGFLEQRAGDRAIQDRLAETHYRVGLITAKIESPKDALESYDWAMAIQRELLRQNPKDRAHRFALANTLNAKGNALFQLGDWDASREMIEESKRLRGQLVEADSGNVEYQRKLANSHMNLGAVLNKLDKTDDARNEFEQAQTIREQLRANEGDEPKVLRDLAKGYFHLGDLLSVAGERAKLANDDESSYFELARDEIDKAVETLQQLMEVEETIEDQFLLNICYFSLARVQSADESQRVIELYRLARAGAEKLVIANPKVDRFRAQLARANTELAVAEFQNGNTVGSEASLLRANELLRQLVHEDPDTSHYHDDLVQVQRLLAYLTGPEEGYYARLHQSLTELAAAFPKVERFQAAVREVEQEMSAPADRDE